METNIFFDSYKSIESFGSITKIKPITEGLSSDQKFYVETNQGKRLLLRVSDISEYERKETIFNLMKQAAALGVPMPQPVDFGLCNGGKKVYQLLTWCEGTSLETILHTLPEAEQYALGIKASEILSTIHSVPAPENIGEWSARYLEETINRLDWFCKSGVKIQGSGAILEFFEANKHLLKKRSQCLHHGDYHRGNLLVTDNQEVSVIDWELLDYGNFADPWEEFNRINSAKLEPNFTTGMIRGYFNGEPPEEFWRLLALYLSAGALMLVSWAFYRQRHRLEECVQTANAVGQWFGGMKNLVPAWYVDAR